MNPLAMTMQDAEYLEHKIDTQIDAIVKDLVDQERFSYKQALQLVVNRMAKYERLLWPK